MTKKKANLIENVIVGEYGYPVFLHLIDENSDNVDISIYDSYSVILRSPDDLKTVTLTGTLFSDGTDGKLYFTLTSGDIDREGTWKGMVKLTDNSPSAVAKSHVFDIKVTLTL